LGSAHEERIGRGKEGTEKERWKKKEKDEEQKRRGNGTLNVAQ